MLRKFLVAGAALVLAAVLAALWWRIDGDQMPEFDYPEPAAVPEPNAYDFLVKAAEPVPDEEAVSEALGGRRNPETWEREPIPMEERREVLANNKETITLLREALRHPFAYPGLYEAVSDDGAHHLDDFRMLGELLALKAEVHRENGRHYEALAAGLDCIELGRKIGEDSVLIGALNGVAISALGRQSFPEIIGQLDNDQLGQGIRRLKEIRRIRIEMLEALRREQGYILSRIESILDHDDWRLELAEMEYGMDPDSYWTNVDEAPLWWRVVMPLRLSRYHKERIVRAHNAMIGEIQQAVQMTFPQGSDLWPEPATSVPSMLRLGDGIRRVWFTLLIEETGVEILLGMLTLEAHRNTHGTYPQDLGELAGDHLDTAARDPFTADQPLQYRREGDGYLLYSIGPDGNDNDGTAMEDPDAAQERRYRPLEDLSGDIVAGVNVLRPDGHR